MNFTDEPLYLKYYKVRVHHSWNSGVKLKSFICAICKISKHFPRGVFFFSKSKSYIRTMYDRFGHGTLQDIGFEEMVKKNPISLNYLYQLLEQ